jgi:hypothetical protein
MPDERIIISADETSEQCTERIQQERCRRNRKLIAEIINELETQNLDEDLLENDHA